MRGFLISDQIAGVIAGGLIALLSSYFINEVNYQRSNKEKNSELRNEMAGLIYRFRQLQSDAWGNELAFHSQKRRSEIIPGSEHHNQAIKIQEVVKNLNVELAEMKAKMLSLVFKLRGVKNFDNLENEVHKLLSVADPDFETFDNIQPNVFGDRMLEQLKVIQKYREEKLDPSVLVIVDLLK